MEAMKCARRKAFEETFYTCCAKCGCLLDKMVLLNKGLCKICFGRCVLCRNIFERYYIHNKSDYGDKEYCKYCLYLLREDEEDEPPTIKQPEE